MSKKTAKTKPKKMWTRKKLSTVFFYEMQFDVIARGDWSDRARMLTPCDTCPRGLLEVGIDTLWQDSLASLVHELVEFALTFQRKSYEPINRWKCTSSCRLFVFQHNDFDEAVARCGEPLAVLVPELANAWNEFHDEAEKETP